MIEEHRAFLQFVQELQKLIIEVQNDIHRAVTGNKRAARRSRNGLVTLEKQGKIYRKLSIKHVDGVKNVD